MKLGNKADAEDFFDREAERADLWGHLEGDNVVLSGPRRLGKTSLLQRLADEAEARGRVARLVDVGGLDTPAGFIGEIEREFPDSTVRGRFRAAGARVADSISRFKKLDVKLPGGLGGGLELQGLPDAPWRDSAQRLQERLQPLPALILIDEFSVFLEKMLVRDAADTERLLGWLRSWRQQSGSACRFVFTGSVSLNALLARHRLSTRFNDCYDYRLGPFTTSSALAMLKTQASRKEWRIEDGSLEHLCDRTGWLSPFFLNLLLSHTMEAGRDRLQETGRGERLLVRSDVDDAYDRLLAARSRFGHWHQRLERDLAQPRLGFALAVLGAISKSDDGLTRRQLRARLQRVEPNPERYIERLSDVMLHLSEDGYLDPEGERIRFLSFVLRDYWRRNHAG